MRMLADPKISVIIRNASWHFLHERDPLIVGIASALLVSTVAMLILSVGAEAFRVVKIAEVYWFFVALSTAAFRLSHMSRFPLVS